MVTSGVISNSHNKKTEIINLAGQTTCDDFEDFPIEVNGAVGGEIQGIPVVCGGYLGNINEISFSNKCYHFFRGSWQSTTKMKEERGWASSIVHNNKMHIMGGRNKSGRLASSEILNGNRSVEGPNLPEKMYRHAITNVNGTTSILSGGDTFAASYSNRTWYYDHERQSFTPGPPLKQARG